MCLPTGQRNIKPIMTQAELLAVSKPLRTSASGELHQQNNLGKYNIVIFAVYVLNVCVCVCSGVGLAHITCRKKTLKVASPVSALATPSSAHPPISTRQSTSPLTSWMVMSQSAGVTWMLMACHLSPSALCIQWTASNSQPDWPVIKLEFEQNVH